MLKPTLLIAAVFAPVCAAWAQSTEATRFVNGQGVELIQNRALPISASAPTASPQGTVQSKMAADIPSATSIAHARPAKTMVAVPDTRFQVSPEVQKARDLDRIDILRQELMMELGDFEAKNKVLRNPAMRAGLDEQQLKRLEEGLQAHERNIRDLNAEITRAVRK